MATVNRITGDTVFVDRLIPQGGIDLSTNCVGDEQFKTSSPLAAEKQQHQYTKTYAQASATTAAAESRVVHVVRGATAEIIAFVAGLVGACVGDATVSLNLKKNGTTVLSSVVTLNNGHSARQTVAGTLSTTALVAGDVLEVTVTVSAGTGTLGTGAFAQVTLHEDSAP